MNRTSWLALVLSAMACNGGKDATGSVDGDADTDTDTDTDADSDSDTDTDPVPAVDADGDGFSGDLDCDDDDGTVFPGAPDLCGDERVTDCDRTSDDGLVTLDGTLGFDELTEALLAAVDDSEILLCPGTYVGNFEATVPVRLVAYGDPTLTVLDGAGSGTTLLVPGGSEIVGLTVSGGDTNQSGGGIRLTTDGTLLVEDSFVADNEARIGGGIAIPPGGVVTLVDTVVRGNSAEVGGGGVFLDGGSLVGGVVSANDTGAAACGAGTPCGGAGIAAYGGASVTGTDVLDNIAQGSGGGVANSGGELLLLDVAVHGNRGESGGGFSVDDGVLRMTGTTEVFDNQATGMGGGGVVIAGSVVAGVVRDNQASEGGGILVIDGAVEDTLVSANTADLGGGLFVNGTVVLGNTLVTGNDAVDGGGIGCHSFDAYLPVASIEGATVSGNSASASGGGVLSECALSLVDTAISDNVAPNGGGLYVVSSTATTMSGGSLVRNTAAMEGGGVSVFEGATFDASVVDFGVDGDDNVPGDAYAGRIEFVGYGDGATVHCDDDGCTPLP